jgi:hypothetical protein
LIAVPPEEWDGSVVLSPDFGFARSAFGFPSEQDVA